MGRGRRLCRYLILDKPLPQGAPGSVIGILGGIIAAVIIISAIVTIFFIYRRQQKNRADTDNDLIDLPPSHKPPPPEKKTEMKSHLTADDIQVVHLDSTKEEEDVQKMPLQTQYYDMAAPESSPYSEKSYNGNRYEELSDEYVSSQHDYHDDYLEQLHPLYNKLSYGPPHLSRHPDAAHRYPQPGSREPYIYPKEQYV